MILAAAWNAFGALGYETTTMRDIIRATDLSVGTFYEYFRDKEEVFAAVAENAWGRSERACVKRGAIGEVRSADSDATLEVIPECGHLIPLEKPSEFHQVVTKFLG